ncbi:ParM/StbA family protein [Clostridium botulinum]|uniref:ParM/StbA family protein n=1 Tax=Clostridium botulinum TaxID=1491 RepID=A0A6B4JNM6_CLOBO|nr:ParM/StbA family protein [Clostridium botulinum]EES48181.1 probable ATPase of HSP70 class, putative [Clostridium botulinum E1 str. 'BoNT E Beluga']MBY6761839.1 ParM/StbA family protein [Clostridium botulinum]MBY6920765.1 ParM/StbA family protein [Clostridium botulinum]MBY6932223.1 ParM/StbA family protein [Clostridium botulinum]MCR1131487.1 ParM/StbA family protein [Clostridium botulinum]
MLIGVDLGNFGVNTSENDFFYSRISDISNFSEENKITYEGIDLYIGDGEFSTNWNKSQKENTMPLLFSALARSSNENFFQIVLGLPIQQYKSNKDEFKKYIEDNRGKTIIYKGIKREIIISDVLIAPEGAAAYYNLSAEQKKLIGNKSLIIVDIGGRTTDVCMFQNKEIKKFKTIPTGMLNIYADIVTEVNNRFTESFKLEEGENILKEGLFLYGEKQDINFVKPILQRHFNSIYKDLQLNFELSKGYVLLTGGGSLILKRPFENRLKNLIISKDPVFDNAKGFKKLGTSIWQEK